MITGYEKLLALRHKKTHEEVSGYQERITIEKYSLKYETPQVSEKYQAVSDEQTPSTSLVHGNEEWIKNVAKLAVTGQLTGPLPVSVKPSYQYILGQRVWFCPNLEAAGNKAPDLAFIPEELQIIIPL